MTKELKDFFIKSEDLLKTAMKKFKEDEDGETDGAAIILALQALENIYNKKGLIYNDYAMEVFQDIETIYTNPIKTYGIYQKYGIFDKEE